ncbi:MAG: dihydroorotase [Bacteroidaceae bacterium]|nr:dihydroorotase [Bacteroidaceae bacterium]
MHYIIKNATLAENGQVVDVEIADERIVTIGKVSATDAEVIDATGLLLLPGVIDDHVHFRDPGLTHKADMHTESCAAAAGGVTSYLEMPNTTPQTTTIEALNDKFEDAARKSVVNYSFFFGATNDNADVLPTLDVHHIPGVKLFMGSSTGNMLVDKREALLKVFGNTPSCMPVMAHCEEMSIINENTAAIKAAHGDDPDVSYHPVIRNAQACYESSKLAVEMAKKTDARLHIAHITTAMELDLLEDKPLSADKTITGEVCIPHLIFNDSDYNTLGARIKCNPAVKTASDQEALLAALKNTDKLDVVGTDHAPHLLSEKQGGCLKAVSGMPMVQFSLVTMLDLAKEGKITYADVVKRMCQMPATLFGINNRGYIKEGNYADLVLVNPATEWTLRADDILSKCKWSPLEGHTFHHKVQYTFCNGHLVYKDGIVDDSYRGKPLSFR